MIVNLSSFLDSNTKKNLIFDCGSSATRIMLGSNLIFNEPTALAVHSDTAAVIAVGQQAYNLIGKNPIGVKVVFPIQAGRIAEPEQFKKFLQAIVKKNNHLFSILNNFFGYSGLFSIPSAANSVEIQIFREILSGAGLGGLKLETGLKGCLYSLKSSSDKISECYLILILGAQSAQLGVFSAGELAYESRWFWGGVRFTEIIQEVMRRDKQLAVSWHTAEAVKKQISEILIKNISKDLKLTIRGKDINSQSSSSHEVKADFFNEYFFSYISELLENLELFISELPTELATACLDSGIYLAGGGSKINDISRLISDHFKTSVYIHHQPEQSIVSGFFDILSKSK